MERMARSAFVSAIALCGVLLGCAPSESGEAPRAPWLRVMCALQGWIESEESRVRGEGVDRCAGAGRQIRSSAERAREILTDDEDPADEDVAR